MAHRKKSLLTLEELSRATGRTYRTVVRRLEEHGIRPTGKRGRSCLYDSTAALEAIYQARTDERRPEDNPFPSVAAALVYEASGLIACLLAESPELKLSAEQITRVLVAVEYAVIARAAEEAGGKRVAGHFAEVLAANGLEAATREVRQRIGRPRARTRDA